MVLLPRRHQGCCTMQSRASETNNPGSEDTIFREARIRISGQRDQFFCKLAMARSTRVDSASCKYRFIVLNCFPRRVTRAFVPYQNILRTSMLQPISPPSPTSMQGCQRDFDYDCNLLGIRLQYACKAQQDPDTSLPLLFLF